MSKLFSGSGLAVTGASDFSAGAGAPEAVKLTADVVVVGSGAGGAVTTYELARAGLRVIILEAGPYVPSSEFREDFDHAMSTLYADRGTQANADGDLLVLQGSCVGGSTVVNGCVAFRTPDHILADWQRDHGLSNLTTAALTPYFERVEKRLSVHRNAIWEINRNSQVLGQGCDKLGISWQPLQRNIKDCAMTGHCLSGCASDRKQSMLVTYLPWALAEGAQLYADTHVRRVLARDGRATGVEAEVRDPRSGKTVATLSVAAERVIVAAGAVQTPLLLQRSQLANGSGQVGRNFACHPSTLVVGDYPERIDSWQGALLGISIDEWAHPDKGGFLLEGGGAGPVELAGVTDPGTGKPFIEFMRRVGHLAGLVTLIHDHNVGDISEQDGLKTINYRLGDADFAAMLAAIRAAARVHFAAGATRVWLPTVQQRHGDSEAEVDAALAGLKNQPHTFRMVSYHPQGTCRMGADPARSVVGPHGETHEVKGLYVADASLLPTSIIVNPQITVYALASYIADGIVATLNS